MNEQLTYESYVQQMRELNEQMQEAKFNESLELTAANDHCNIEHKRLKAEMLATIAQVNQERDAQLREIHSRYAHQRAEIYRRQEDLIFLWKRSTGTQPPYAHPEGRKGGDS
ncbi:MAG: hypothetical protein IKH59_01760 [Bacteroidaceae bacterium]|nr:hypothetical protein [Bacteroidaceae bacterium]